MVHMNKIAKSMVSVNGNSVQMGMPFAKVDKENRLVFGWATLDNLDTQDDIVTADASVKAFSRARGNIREMHQPLAVGKMLDFREDEYFDPEDNQLYRGIFVTAHVSKGAQDTWEKVLDGTLSGFSIGGEIIEATNDFDKAAGRNVRKILDYDLTELSLVDNPANQKANMTGFQKNVASFTKAADGTVNVELGEVASTVVENVFICPVDTTVVVKASDSVTCPDPDCGANMENAGWFESGENRTEKVRDIVTKFLSPDSKEVQTTSEGGVEEVKKSNNAPVPEGKEVSSPNPKEARDAGDENAVATVDEEAAAAAETEAGGTEADPEGEPKEPEAEDEESEISKKLEEVHQAIKKSLEESAEETNSRVAELEKKIDETNETFLAKATELEEKISGFGEKIETQKNRLAEFENALRKLNDSDAFKKSADLEPAEQVVQKDSFWGSAFSGR